MFSGANSLLVSGSVVGGGNFKYFFWNFHAANPWGRWMFNVRVLKPWRFGDDFLRIQKSLGNEMFTM